jgi:hypothetical protein
VRVTVLITNYNYVQFLPHAIDSVLAQRYPSMQVLIIDDGSTDGSRDIIADYGNRITSIMQANAGQAAAVNRGIDASTGDVVCFLDADDAFLPRKVERVVAEFGDPTVQLVYHQLQPVEADGLRPIGKPIPRAVWRGNIRAQVERSGGWWPRPTTSGLAFRRSFLERVSPVPTDHRVSWTDTYLAGLAPFVGNVAGIREPLGILRLHGSNAWSKGASAGRPDVSQLSETRRDQYEAEFHALEITLREKLGIEPSLSLADHLRFQQYRFASGEPVARWRVVAAALRCPSLPPSMRWREAARIALGRW